MVMKIIVVLAILAHAAVGLHVGVFSPWNLRQETVDSRLSMVLIKIMARYDLLVMYGIPDADVMRNLFDKFQKETCDYEMIITPVFDKPGLAFPDVTVFIYKKNMMTLSHPTRDQLSGASYCTVRLLANGFQFVFLGGHMAVVRAIQELELMPGAYERLVTYTKIQDVLMGLSAASGPPFLNQTQFDNLSLTKNNTFRWYLDATTMDNIALPDQNFLATRFISAGRMHDLVIADSAGVLNITDYYGLTYEETLGVSPIFPVEIEVKEGMNPCD